MTAKRFNRVGGYVYDGDKCISHFEDVSHRDDIVTLLNELAEENEQLRNRLKDWHQKTFKAHEYFNILEKVIDEVCDDDVSNQIWKEYEKREKLIE